MPKTRPVSTEQSNAKPKTLKSSVTFAPGSVAKRRRLMNATRHIASRRLSAPPRSDDEALGQRLAQQADAPGAERGTDGVFAGARRGADELEVGEVGAGDEQHEAGQAEREPHDVPRRSSFDMDRCSGSRRMLSFWFVECLSERLAASATIACCAPSIETPGFRRANDAQVVVAAVLTLLRRERDAAATGRPCPRAADVRSQEASRR